MAFKKSANPKTSFIKLRVTAEQKAQIQDEAKARLLGVSDFLLRRALGKQTPVEFEYIAMSDLERMIADLKQLYREAGERECDDKRLMPLVTEMATAVQALWKRRGRT